MKNVLLVFTVFLLSLAGILCFAQETESVPGDKAAEVYNPFADKLPDKQVSDNDHYGSGPGPVESVMPEDIDIPIQGIVWGTELPQVIIEGKVYTIGDKLKEYESEIISIDKGKIAVIYQGARFTVPLKKDKEKPVTNR